MSIDEELPGWIDARGALHRPAAGEVRIVSLVPSLTELVVALGLGDQLVGRTRFCIHPRAELASVANVGGTKQVAMDRIRGLHPTHAIVNIDENTREMVEELEAFVPNVVVTHPVGPRDNLELFRGLGTIFGVPERAEALSEAFERAWAEVASTRFVPRRALYLIWRDPYMTVSRQTYVSRMLAAVGIETIPEQATVRYPEVQLESAMAADAEIVLLSSEPFPFKAEHIAEVCAIRPAWEGNVYLIDGEMVSWYGPRAIDGLRYLVDFRRQLDGALAA